MNTLCQIGSTLLTRAINLASAMQYALISLTILAVYAPVGRLSMLPTVHADTENLAQNATKADLLEAYALDICGMAFTTNIPSVIVNTFGPIAYCKCMLACLWLLPPF